MTGAFCDLIWSDPLLEHVLGFHLCDQEFSEVTHSVINDVRLFYDIVKRHFYACEKFMRICQNGPLDKFMRFLFVF